MSILRNIFAEGELDESVVVSKMEITTAKELTEAATTEEFSLVQQEGARQERRKNSIHKKTERGPVNDEAVIKTYLTTASNGNSIVDSSDYNEMPVS